MENSKKSNFLVTWGSIMLLLVLVCALGVSNTVKGTKAAETCTCPYGGELSSDGSYCGMSKTSDESGDYWTCNQQGYQGPNTPWYCTGPSSCPEDDTGDSGDKDDNDNVTESEAACTSGSACFYVAEDYVWTSKDTYCNFNESTGDCTCRPTPDEDKDEETCKALGATEPDDTDKDDNDNVTESEAACISGEACFWAAEDYLWTSREQMNCKYDESNNTCSCDQPVVPGIIEAQYCNEYSATCDAGTYYEGPDSNGGNMCVECPEGYYCPGGTFNPNSDSYGKYSCMAYNGGTSKAGSSTTDDCKNPCEGENSFLTSLAPSFAPIYCERQGFDFYRITNLGGNPACSTIECCNCEGEECEEEKEKGYYACWYKSGEGYKYGLNSDYVGWTEVSSSYCFPSDSGTSNNPNSPSSNPSTPSSSSSSNPSSSKPSTSNPSTSTSSGSTSKDNVEENPKTADVLMYVVWIAGLVSIGYSVWYFKNTRKVN